MDTSYTKQNVNTTQHDHNYFITADAEGLMNENYADVNRSIFNDASTDQLDKDVSSLTFGTYFFKFNIFICTYMINLSNVYIEKNNE